MRLLNAINREASLGVGGAPALESTHDALTAITATKGAAYCAGTEPLAP